MSIISNCTASAIKDAATTLMNGNLVAFPTETVYGLGADATNKGAIARIYKVKGRPEGHPLIIHISSIGNLDKWARDIPEYALNLAKAFWPGPMTLILPRTDLAKDFITGGQDNVGIRVPSHSLAGALLKEFEDQGGLGVAAPSANRFGKVSPTTAAAVQNEIAAFLKKSDVIIDGGPSEIGIESTIIDCTTKHPIILRPGAITFKMISRKLSLEIPNLNLISTSKTIHIRAPGNFMSHYAPDAQVILNGIPKSGDGLIALRNVTTPKGVIRLSSPANKKEFASTLYAALRSADELKIKKVFVTTPDQSGIGAGIIDRLIKASSSS
jgi:L-threonylcarbamoyladenylate synthase